MTYNPDAIVVFAQTPGISEYKPALADIIGEEKSNEFNVLSLGALQSVLKPLTMEKYWAVEEEEGAHYPYWLDFKTLWSGNGDMGHRQNHIYDVLGRSHAHIMLLRSDCPQISADFIKDGFAQLKTHDYVFGPAENGGYYMFAGRKPVAPHIWTGVDFTRETAMNELAHKLKGSVQYLDALTTVDQAVDLPKMIFQMPHNMTEAQIEISTWAKTILET